MNLYWRTSENPIYPNLACPGPIGQADEGAYDFRKVLSISNVREATNLLSLHKKATWHMIGGNTASRIRTSEKTASALPRCQIYERSGYRYLRSDLLVWLRERSDSHVDSHPAAHSGTRTHKKALPRVVTRLV